MTEPRFALTTELITVTDGNYIVRASLCAQQNIITTALAAAPTVEEAEDKARQRVMGFYHQVQHLEKDFESYVPTTVATGHKEKVTSLPGGDTRGLTTHMVSSYPGKVAAPRENTTVASSSGVVSPVARENTTFTSSSGVVSSVARENTTVASSSGGISSVPRPSGTTTHSSVSTFSLSTQEGTSFDTSPSLQQPAAGEEEKVETIDFSKIIEETTREMKRLGWTQEDGKKYLLETYGKKSRHLLTDEELLEFLNYLKSQPS